MPEFVGHPRIAGGVPIPDFGTAFELALRPLGLIHGNGAKAACAAGAARPLAGPATAFTTAELFVEQEGRVAFAVGSLGDISGWAAADPRLERRLDQELVRIGQPRPPFAGLDLERPLVMGIVNVTPDSFSDGGRYADTGSAIAHGRKLQANGADILDIGGESTRPGATATDPAIESGRIVPVIKGLAGSGCVISADTRRASVMREAVAAGASIINDVGALEDDPEALDTGAASGASVILMHKQGDPRTMQGSPTYGHALYEVFAYLRRRVAACESAGIPRHRIAVDPGIGFGKTAAHNAELVAGIAMLHGLGCPVVLGASRKMSAVSDPLGRIGGSLAATLFAASQGVQIHRVHDVAETCDALRTMGRMARES